MSIRAVILLLASISSFAYAEVVTCGLDGNIQERIEDCGKKYSEKISLRGMNRLIGVTSNNHKIFYNLDKKIFWGDRLKYRYNHEDAKRVCLNYGSDIYDIEGVKWRLPRKDDSPHMKYSNFQIPLTFKFWYWMDNSTDDTQYGRNLISMNDWKIYRNNYMENTYSVRCVGEL